MPALTATPGSARRESASVSAHVWPMRGPFVLLFAGALLLASGVLANAVPLPPPRPALDPPPVRTAPPPAPRAPLAASRPDSVAPCTELLSAGIAEAELSHSVSGISGAALCGSAAPVRLSAILLRDGRRVELRPHASARCEMALAFARWVREDVAPAAALAGGAVERLEIASSYVCRPRNHVEGARLSEHGRANAIDVRAITLAGDGSFPMENSQAPALLLAAMRRSACARFTTVLGPGADAAHVDHIHVDLAERRGGYRICQWNMPDWPLP